jgi:hypothetical protein
MILTKRRRFIAQTAADIKDKDKNVYFATMAWAVVSIQRSIYF